MRSYLEELDNRQGWCLNRQSIVVGVSGGRDSMALLHLLSTYAERVIAVHVNYGLRGEDSMADEQYCIDFCKLHDIEIIVHRDFSINKSKQNIQSVAREIRYSFFESVRKKKQANFIATAHHSQDNLEHFFLYLLRDNLQGAFEGIPIRNGNIIRPLIHTPMEVIDQYVLQNSIKFRTDKSNLKVDYLRNKVRHWIIPILKNEDSLLGHKFKEVSILTNRNKQQVLTEFNSKFNLKKLDNYYLEFSPEDLKKYQLVITELLFKKGFSRDNITKALLSNSRTGSTWLGGVYKLVKTQYNTLILYREFDPRHMNITIDKIDSELLGFEIEFSNSIPLNWYFKKVQVGDRIKLKNSGHYKKISDLFTDHKINHFYRERSWILSEGEYDLALIIPNKIWETTHAPANFEHQVKFIDS